jgi:anti-anti-sigma factor
MELLVVDREVRDEALLVTATGEVDSNTAEQFATELDAALAAAAKQATRLIILDLEKVTYFGSAGLNVVLDFHAAAAEASTTVRVVAENGVVAVPFRVTKLDRVLPLYPTLSDALQGNIDP